jgi:dTDP-4-amino-4,6-dideoxygalactose transaminase
MKTIPLVDLKAQYEPLKAEILSSISDVLEGMKLFLGENVFQLESEFAGLCGAKLAIGVGSGTDAIYLALRALNVGVGDEVITQPNSFMATASAVAMTGATPVFVDVEPDTYTLDPVALQQAITPRTKAIIPVHLYGHPADMQTIGRIAASHNVPVIEDACQSHGAECHRQRTGSMGAAAAFSFYFSKNLGAYGEGGIVTTNDRTLATRVQLLRNHGSSRRYEHAVLGMNSRLDELQAAVLRIKLRHLGRWNERRRLLAAQYTARLNAFSELTLPVERPWATHVYHLYVIRAPYRDEMLKYLNERGIGAAIHYPIPIHLQEATRHLGYSAGDFPVVEQAAREILSLPIYAELESDDIDYICETIGDFLRAKRGRRAPAPSASRGGGA